MTTVNSRYIILRARDTAVKFFLELSDWYYQCCIHPWTNHYSERMQCIDWSGLMISSVANLLYQNIWNGFSMRKRTLSAESRSGEEAQDLDPQQLINTMTIKGKDIIISSYIKKLSFLKLRTCILPWAKFSAAISIGTFLAIRITHSHGDMPFLVKVMQSNCLL